MRSQVQAELKKKQKKKPQIFQTHLEEYQQVVAKSAELFKDTSSPKKSENNKKRLEALGDD